MEVEDFAETKSHHRKSIIDDSYTSIQTYTQRNSRDRW